MWPQQNSGKTLIIGQSDSWDKKRCVGKNGLKKTENIKHRAYGKETITWTEYFSARCWPMSEEKKSIVLFAGSQASPVCPSEKNANEMKMSV